MLLTVNDLITLVRSSVNVQVPTTDEDGNVVLTEDEDYLSMTDEDIELFIKLGVTRAYPEVQDLSELPEGSEFALVLLAKIELYMKLAVIEAPKVDMGADNNNYLKQDQRFSHYTKLAEDAKEQYDTWLEKESIGANTVSSYDVLLSSRHYSLRNYEKQVTPKVYITIDETTSSGVKFHWKMKNSSHFARFKVYIGTSAVIDMYADGAKYSDKLTEDAQCIKSTGDIHDVYHEVTGLEPETTYYIAVISIERNQVFGYSQISFTTLEEEEDEEDLSITDLSD